MALSPWRNPTTCATEYLGRIEISMCTGSDFRHPSKIWFSFWMARSLNHDPRYPRNSFYKSFLRYLEIHAKRYLHSHYVRLKLCLSSTESLLVLELWAVHPPGRLSYFYRFVNSRKWQTLWVPRQSRGFTRLKLISISPLNYKQFRYQRDEIIITY